jgi:hypothetical protein
MDSGIAPEPVSGPDPLGAPRNDGTEFCNNLLNEQIDNLSPNLSVGRNG